MVSPVKVGEVYDVTIETVGSKGDGVAKINGYVVFVKNVNEGDKLKIRITKALDKVGFADIVETPAETKDLPELPPEKADSDNDEADSEELKEDIKEETDIIPEEEGAPVPDSEGEEEEEKKPEAELDEDEVPEA